MEGRYQVKLIERSAEVAQSLAEQLSETLVLQGDAADEDLLREENIERTDIFCAVTNDDQVNILSTMLAKRMGTRKVMALINRGAYVDLVQSGTIDIAISPQQATIGTLLGDVVVVHSLRRGACEQRPLRQSLMATEAIRKWWDERSRRLNYPQRRRSLR